MAAPVHYKIHNNTFWLLPQKALYWEEEKALIISDLHLGKTGHFRKEGIAVPQWVYKTDLHCLFHIIQYYKPEQLIIAGDMFHSRMNREVDLFTKWRNDVPHLHIHLVKGNHDILHDDRYTEAGITVSHQRLQVGSFCFVHDIGGVGDVNSPWSMVHGENSESPIMNRQSSMVNGEPGMLGNSEVRGDKCSKTEGWKLKTGNRKLETENSKPETGNQKPVTGNSQPCYYFSGHIHPAVILKSGSRQSLRFPCYYFAQHYAVLPAFSAFSGLCAVSPKKNEKIFAIVNGSVMKL